MSRIFASFLVVEASRQNLVADLEPTVAVLEHTVRWGKNWDAEETIRLNLDVYEAYAKEAAAAGAKLLVTPEYGVTGYPGSNREWWWPFGTDIPEVEALGHSDFIPCISDATPQVLRRLSCMARDHDLSIVASLIDMKDCSLHESYPGCSSSRDGWLLLNTDVVFDGDGRFLAKYHKSNKWGEAPVDAAADCQAVTFKPRGFEVDFGLFTCADLIHQWPVLHMVSRGIRHFVMPLAWSNEMNQMQPLAWLQSWSRVMNVTLLAANARDPRKETGSGIFSQGSVIKKAYSLAGPLDEMLLASLPQLPSVKSPPAVCPRRSEPSSFPEFSWALSFLDMSPGTHTKEVCRDWDGEMSSLCCELNYIANFSGYGFVLAALNGGDSSPGITPWAGQACAVLPCVERRFALDGQAYTHQEFLEWYGEAEGEKLWENARQDVKSCLDYPLEELQQHGSKAFGSFATLQMQGSFSSSARIFPMLLTDPTRLSSPRKLKVSKSGRSVSVSGAEAEKLIQLEMYGRLYSKDRGYSTCPCEGPLSQQLAL